MSGHLEHADVMDVDETTPIGQPVRSIEGWIVLVVNLHEETSEEDLQDTFAEFGAIRNMHLNLDRRTGYVKGYAFIEYAKRAEADAAVNEANGTTFLGQQIEVGFAFVNPPQKERDGQRTLDEYDDDRDRSRSPERRDET